MSATPPTAPITFARPSVQSDHSDNALVLSSSQPLLDHPSSLAGLFHAACDRQPNRTFLAEPDGEESGGGDWHRITYAQARIQVDAVAAALLQRGLSAERPIAILSGNSIDHAVLMLAAHVAGIPVSPISVAYSLQSQDLAKLRHCRDLLTPGLVYAADTGPFGRALDVFDCEITTSTDSANRMNVTPFADMKDTPAVTTPAITPGTIAKFLFTSGSTSLPKAVINTHGMLASNQQAIAQVWPFLDEQPLVLVDWLPWNHTFGGNHNFNMVLKHAGTLYIDAGKPVPALFAPTLKALSEVSPTICFNVPAGFSTLLPHLEGDLTFARQFFSNLKLIFYAGAALPQDLWTRLEDIALKAEGHRIPMTSSWGLTETSPAITMAHFPLDRAGNIGVPVPGSEVKLAPVGDLLEARVRGPNVTPGYWRSPEKTSEAFDADGFYCTGDAVRLADAKDPSKGLVFNGRTAEDFKLSTGTWVRVGALRVGIVAACSPMVQDVVVAGEGHDDVRLLAWLNAEGCRKALGYDAAPDAEALARDPRIHAHLIDAIKMWNNTNTGASMRIAAVKILTSAPDGDANEITDKGYVNQRAALGHRSDAVLAVYGSNTTADMLIL